MHTHPAATLPDPVSSACPASLRGLFLVMLLLLGGCAAHRPLPPKTSPEPASWELRQGQLQNLSHWQLKGRVAVQLHREGGSASLQWQQQAEDYVLRLIGPLGRGSLELQGNRAGVSMWDRDNRVVHADSAEALLDNYLGWQVPVSGLRYWIRGIPDPGTGAQAMVLDDRARLAELVQSGWHITYRAYKTIGELELPTKLELAAPNLRVKLAIRDWELGP